MLVNYHYENLPIVAVRLAPYDEHQEPLTKSNGVCMVPQLHITIPKQKQKGYT